VTLIGGSGLIGTALSRTLSRAGYRVFVLDLEPPHPSVEGLVEWSPCDVTNRSELESIPPCESVYFLAALLGKRCVEEPELGWHTNVNGLIHTVEAIRAMRHRPTLTFFSSASVYAFGVNSPIEERDSAVPSSLYASSKLLGEAMLHAAGTAFGLRSIILRPFTAYGPGPGSGKKGHLIWTWIERALRGDPIVIHGDGTQTVDLVHTEDLAALCVAAESRQVAEWFRSSLPGLRVEFERSIRPAQRRNFASIDRARELLGYAPRVLPSEGIKGVIDSASSSTTR
jgi:UDP-glucose 4-epimerase